MSYSLLALIGGIFCLTACAVQNSRLHSFPTQVSAAVTGSPEPAPTQILPMITESPVVEATPTAEMPTPEPEEILFQRLWMHSSNHGWAMETNGRILRTVDGGESWKDVSPPQGSYSQAGFYVLDVKTAWATPYQDTCGEKCETVIWRTVDGGESWQPSQPLCVNGNCGIDFQVVAEMVQPVQLAFEDVNNGWLLFNVQHLEMQDRYRIYRTTDGGNTWTMVSDSASGPAGFKAAGLLYTDENTAWFGLNQMGGAQAPSPAMFIYNSLDGGKLWQTYNFPPPKQYSKEALENPFGCGLISMERAKSLTMDILFKCEFYTATDIPPFYYQYHTINGGENWTRFYRTGDVDFINDLMGFRISRISESEITLEQTRDAGAHWDAVRYMSIDGKLEFINELTGWLITNDPDHPMLFSTIDGGLTWEKIVPVRTNDIAPILDSSKTQTIILFDKNGETFPAVYYPPSLPNAPVVVLMHQIDRDMRQWEPIAAWLWKQDLGTFAQPNEKPWLDPSWFPENTLNFKPGILIFTYRGCENGCTKPQAMNILADAQTALLYVLNRPEIDPERLTVLGTSVGADAALDSCFLLQDTSEYACQNVISASPGSYLDYNFRSVTKLLVEQQTHVYCFASLSDADSAVQCMNDIKAANYHPFIGQGNQHGVEMFSPTYEANILETLLQAINK
jgi:photosystem II stability/assembly factor-like uncharacterized protein